MRLLTAGLLAAALASCLSTGAEGAYCNGSPSPNHPPNLYPVTASDPEFVTSVQNGKLFSAGTPGFNFSVLHLYGSPYDMGYAHGQLMIYMNATQLLPDLWDYIVGEVEQQLVDGGLPSWLADLIAQYGLEVAFGVLFEQEKPFINPQYLQEMMGLANATNFDYTKVIYIHLLGELTQGDCSMLGAWGSATPDGKLMAFRALDWDTSGPFIQWPAVIVRHPQAGSGAGHAFSSVGFLGWTAVLSGMSSAGLSIHEIGVSYPDPAVFGPNETFAGIPFVFLMRDVLQFDANLSAAASRIEQASRTCYLLLGVGDGNSNSFLSFIYSQDTALPMTDATLLPDNSTWHPRQPGLNYFGMDYLCPSYNLALYDSLMGLYGNITAANIISTVLPTVQTGDTHAAVYDLPRQQLYVSFYATLQSPAGAPLPAYDRQFTQLNCTALYAEPAPPAVAGLLAAA